MAAPTKTLTEQALAVMDAEHTPEQLEAAIKAQGDLVELHVNAGRMQFARDAARVVLQLNQMRTPETVAALEEARDLQRLEQIEEQRENDHQDSLR